MMKPARGSVIIDVQSSDLYQSILTGTAHHIQVNAKWREIGMNIGFSQYANGLRPFTCRVWLGGVWRGLYTLFLSPSDRLCHGSLGKPTECNLLMYKLLQYSKMQSNILYYSKMRSNILLFTHHGMSHNILLFTHHGMSHNIFHFSGWKSYSRRRNPPKIAWRSTSYCAYTINTIQ